MQAALKTMRQLWQRDALLMQRQQSTWLNPLLFYTLIATLFPLAIAHDDQTLNLLGPGVLWVGALIATYLSLDALFRSDFEDGTLEQWILSPISDYTLVCGRLCSHWLACGIPLSTTAVLLGLMYHLSLHTLWALFLGLLLGTSVMSNLGAIGIALTVAVDRAGILLGLIVLPLYIPVLIIGSVLALTASAGMPINAPLALLAALAIFAAIIGPIATVGALRLTLQ